MDLTEQTIQDTWDGFRGDWDFDRIPELRIPIRYRVSAQPADPGVIPPMCIVVRKEVGRVGPPSMRRKAVRLVGTVPGTSLFKVLAQYVEPLSDGK
jgi:hypothetical protein